MKTNTNKVLTKDTIILKENSQGSAVTAHATLVPCSAAAKQTILLKYSYASTIPSDVYEHVPVIWGYVSQYPVATEIGVRNVVSSWAFAKAGMERISAGNPFTYRAVDITRAKEVDDIVRVMHECPSINFSFIEGDDLVIKPWHTDVLLIDTWHVYRQLNAELRLWAPFVSRYILFHDTETFGNTDEGFGGHGGKPIDESLYDERSNQGLMPAIEQYLADHPEWVIYEKKNNNNGLTVLIRRFDSDVKTRVSTLPA